MVEIIERFYSSLLCASLGLLGVLLLIWPLSRRLGAQPKAWRRAWYLFPIGLACLAAAVIYQRWSSAHLGATLIIAAVSSLGLALAAIFEHRKRRY